MTLTKVRVRDCACPDTPHEGHHVFLRPTISLEGGIEAEKAMFEVARKYDVPNGKDGKPDIRSPEAQARSRALVYAWAPIFVEHGAVDWDLCDEQGEPIPFDVQAILDDYAIARLVADKASELGYGDAVMAPFQDQPATPSPSGPTPATTSQRRTRTRR